MFSCASCETQTSDGPACCNCKNRCCFPCSGITELGYRKLGERKNTWRCPKCPKSKPSQCPQPVPASSPAASGATSPLPNLQLDSMQAQLNMITTQLAPLSTLAEDVKALRSEMNSLRESLDMAHGLIEKFTSSVKNLESRVTKVEQITQTVPAIQTELRKLQQEFDERDQWARANNVEIRGIPSKKNENLYEITENISKIANFNFKKEDINYIARIPTRVPNVEKPIIISFNNRYKKEDFVSSARQSKNLNLKNLGFSGDKAFYVNDHLTQRNKNLLNKAKSLSKEHNFLYVWVKHSKIMIRKSDQSPIIYIKSEVDLEKIS